MKFYQNLIFTFVFLASYAAGFSQKGITDGSQYGHGEDSVQCLRNMSLSREYSRNKNYEEALKYWRNAIAECPRSSKNLYIDGVNIIKNEITKASDPKIQSAYVDTLMLLYDWRIQHFGERGNVLGRKGVDLMRYRRDELPYVEQAYQILRESVNLEKGKSNEAAMATLFSSGILLYRNNKLTAEQVLNDYTLLSDITKAQLAKKPTDKDIITLRETLDQNLAQSGAATCDKMSEIFSPKYELSKTDLAFLENLTTLLNLTNCQETKLFFDASVSLDAIKPSALSAGNIATMAYKKEDFQTSYNFFKKAVERETDNIKKAEYLYSLAGVASKLELKSESRTYALQAADLKPGWGDPYILIGTLYAGSRSDCPGIKLPNAIYWAAIDKFLKAKAVDASCAARADQLIDAYRPHYPNKEEAFFNGIKEGDNYRVECWINEDTKARF